METKARKRFEGQSTFETPVRWLLWSFFLSPFFVTVLYQDDFCGHSSWVYSSWPFCIKWSNTNLSFLWNKKSLLWQSKNIFSLVTHSFFSTREKNIFSLVTHPFFLGCHDVKHRKIVSGKVVRVGSQTLDGSQQQADTSGKCSQLLYISWSSQSEKKVEVLKPCTCQY